MWYTDIHAIKAPIHIRNFKRKVTLLVSPYTQGLSSSAILNSWGRELFVLGSWLMQSKMVSGTLNSVHVFPHHVTKSPPTFNQRKILDRITLVPMLMQQRQIKWSRWHTPAVLALGRLKEEEYKRP